MIPWFALLIPAIGAVILWKYFHSRCTWWELFIPTVISALFILIFKFTAETVMVTDNEYWGSIVVKARYYERWETYVHKTCEYDCNCTTDKDGRESCETCYKDCSYCDTYPAYWEAYDNAGNTFRISEEYYNQLKNKWSSQPQFIELNRSITEYFGCGDDGDAYEISWNSNILTSESAVTVHTYENKVQASHSSFKLPVVEKEEARKLKLYDYPDFYDYYKQKVILGLDSIYGRDLINQMETQYQYMNGLYGPKSKVKVFVLLFYGKPQDIAFKQQAYWDGGNQNEVVVCIGLDKKTHNIQWVRPFSWTDNKRILVDLREDITDIGFFNPVSVLRVIEKTITDKRVYKDFKKDFDYLDVDLKTWQIVLIYVLTALITTGICVWNVNNGFDNDEHGNNFMRKPWSHYLKQRKI